MLCWRTRRLSEVVGLALVPSLVAAPSRNAFRNSQVSSSSKSHRCTLTKRATLAETRSRASQLSRYDNRDTLFGARDSPARRSDPMHYGGLRVFQTRLHVRNIRTTATSYRRRAAQRESTRRPIESSGIIRKCTYAHSGKLIASRT